MPGRRGTTPVRAALRVVRVLWAPRAVFDQQQARPAWFGPWALLALIVVAAGLVSLPYSDRVSELALQAPDAGTVPPWLARLGRWLAVGAAPVYMLVLALLSALLMRLALLPSGRPARFRGLLSAAVFSQATIALQAILQSLVLRLRGPPSVAIRSLADARVSLGADLLLPAGATGSPFVHTLLSGIGPLQIWGLIITAVGVMVLEKQGKGAAWTAATLAYLVLLVGGGLLSGLGAQ